jgi:site-specific DNA-methyltransferase (adenine-specific)
LNVAGAQPGQIVYDPFGGTGTTMVVAKEMMLDGITTEIDIDYYNFIQARLK